VSLILKINLFVLTLLKFCKKKKLNKKFIFCKKKKLNKKFIFCKKNIYIFWISKQKKKSITTKLIHKQKQLN